MKLWINSLCCFTQGSVYTADSTSENVDPDQLCSHYLHILRWMDTSGRFCHHFAKGDNFERQEVFLLVLETKIVYILSYKSRNGGKYFHVKVISLLSLSHITLASLLWNIGKQCRPRSHMTLWGVWSRSLMFAYRNFNYKQNINKKYTWHPLNNKWTHPMYKDGKVHLFRLICTIITLSIGTDRLLQKA